VRITLTTGLIAAALFALGAAPPAFADSATSSNWAGYAVHRAGVKFTKVIGAWRQPAASCTVGHQSYSAMWVGLGGFSLNSGALEQIGTEVDCTAAGKVSSTAWYELVPAGSQPISLRVRPGDALLATVTVAGHQVVMGLYDQTTNRSFQKTLRAPFVDVSSAEWILEAPSECISATSCQTLPLTNFGSAAFGLGQAVSTTGHLGTIVDPAWGWTRIQLTPGQHRYVVSQGSGAFLGAATPSGLSARGNSFGVTFSKLSLQGYPSLVSRRAVVRAGQLAHPRR
jgi:Peptidase A4 family